MRTIKELQKRLTAAQRFEERYDLEQDDKVHLLYVSPTMNATGYYRMIAPALEINKTDSHKAIITSIESNDFAKKLSDFVGELDERLITWADYIVFPSIFSDVTYLIQAIKTLNSQVQLIMDIHQNYFAVPDSIPLSRKLTQEKLKYLETNIGLMDLVTVASQPFQKFLQKFIANRLPKSNALVQYLPTLISRFGYEEMPPLKRNSKKPLRIGLIKPIAEDLLSLKEVFVQIQATSLRDEIQLVCLGKPYSSKEVDLLLKETNCELHNSVSFFNYFEKLNDLKLDFVLLPAKEGLYNRHQNIQTFLELSVFGIPVIASIHHPATRYIVDGETGFVAAEVPEWIQIIRSLKNAGLDCKARLSSAIIKSLWKEFSFSKSSLDAILDMFV